MKDCCPAQYYAFASHAKVENIVSYNFQHSYFTDDFHRF